MRHVSPERIGSRLLIGDDGRKKEDVCRFIEYDLFNIVDDLENLDDLPMISADDLLTKIEHGEPIDCDHVIVNGDLDIRNLDLEKDEEGFSITNSPITIRHSLICGTVYLTTGIFKGNVDFLGSLFGCDAYFYESKLDGSIFQQSIFNGIANFRNTEFISNAYFNESIFYSDANFYQSQFNGGAFFNWCQFLDYINFGGSRVKGDAFSFKDALFKDPSAQEEACRRAKIICEKHGNRELAAYHFYREMEAIRKRKGFFSGRYFPLPVMDRSIRTENWSMIKSFLWYDVIEYVFVQGIFGYGVHPKRLMISWGGIVIAFGVLYWIGDGLNEATQLFDHLKFSLAVAIAPGYIATIISPGSPGYSLRPEYQAVAIIETILGTFLWASFIATFAKKYMR